MRTAFRLLPLPFCIALSLAAHAAEDRPETWKLCPITDAVPAFPDAQAPVAEPETQRAEQPTDIEGDTLSGTDVTPEFEGNVALRRGDQFLGTRKLTYDSETGKYVAEGDVRYQDAGMRMVAKRAEGDQNADTHNIQDVEYQLTSRRGNGGAEHIEMHGAQGTLYGSTYSTCPPDDRRWELRAERIDVDTEEGVGVAHNATLRVGKVPVLYVPWFEFPIDDRRKTGLLYPTIGSSSRNGFDYRQPIYLNLAPNYDMTLTPRLMTDRGVQLGAEFRYLTETGRGVFDTAYMPDDRLRDMDRGIFRFLGSQDLGPTWQARSRINWISDDRYLEDFSNNLYGLSPYSVESDVGLFGRGHYWDAGLMADYNQLSDHTLTEAALPYNRLPRAFLRWDQPLRPWLDVGIDAEAVRFQHPVLFDGNRVDAKPFVSMPFEGSGWFVTPKLAWRYTGYQLDPETANVIAFDRAEDFADANGVPLTPDLVASFRDENPSRSLPIGSLDAGLYFDRDTAFGGEGFLQTLEPRLFYLKVPYRNQEALPLFDTRPLTFSWGQLFRDNRYTGADRQTDANQITLALTTRLIRQSDGREKLSASVGQIHYFDDSRVTILDERPVEQGKSAWVADANWAITDRWTVGASYQWDPKFRRENLAAVRTRFLVRDEGIVNFQYRYRRDLLDQADLSFLYPVSPSWSLVGRYYYSFYRDARTGQEPGLLEAIAGVQWDSCCLAVRLVGRRYIHNREGELNNAIQIELELKGLGSAGPDMESRLRRAILGYRREDLYLVPPSEVSNPGDDEDSSPNPFP